MKEDVFTCDICERSTSNPQVQRVWTQIELKVTCGMARISRTIDMCPECQDTVFSYMRSMSEDATKGKESRKSFLECIH